jgi:cytochrome P450
MFLRMARPHADPDPYPLYARLREIGPVVPVVFPGVAARYLVTTFAACTAMLRDENIGPLTEDHFHETNPTWKEQGLASSLFGSMAFHSGTEHRSDRAMFAKHFSPRRTGQRRGDMVEVATNLLDQLELLATAGEPVDIERELAVPYSALIIGRLMGIPDDQALRLGWLTRQASPTLELAPSPAQRQQAAEAGGQMVKELIELAADRRRQPREDLITDLATQCGDDEERLVNSLVLLFSAGFDSPTSVVGMGLRLFLDNPEQAQLLREDPTLADTATEEILRCEPAVQVMFRAAFRDVTLAGVTIPEGSILLGLIAGACRDPALVDNPDRFDIRRPPSSGLSFGGGAHYCLGAHLARLSGTVLFPMLLRRFPLMQLAEKPTYRSPGVALRGFERMPVILSPSPS